MTVYVIELLAIEAHLKKLCKLSRPEDTVKLVRITNQAMYVFKQGWV